MSAKAPPAAATEAAAIPFAVWPVPLAAWDEAAAKELVETWACACGAWTDYLSRLATAVGPAAVLEAGAQLMADSLDVCGRAAAVRLQSGGVRAPLLNDA